MTGRAARSDDERRRQGVRRGRRGSGSARKHAVLLQPEHTQTGVRRRLPAADHLVDVSGHGVRLPVRRRARNALSSEYTYPTVSR